MKKVFLFLATAALLAAGAASAATKYVKPGAGSAAWAGKADVYATIAAAISAAAEGDEIWVAQGSYSISATLTWKNGVSVYGGFAGNETDKAQRSMNALLTIIDGSGGGVRLLAASGALSTPTTWSGFTFQNSTGGGVQLHASCILDNCVVRNNTRADVGAGILADAGADAIGADIVIQRCKIINNNTSGGGGGGGIRGRAAKTSTGKLVIKNCVIANNKSANDGGGVALTGIPYEMTSCTLAKNTRSGSWPGGALYSSGGKAVITSCLFWGNVDATGYGGARNDFFLETPAAGTKVTSCLITQEITSGTGYNSGEVIQHANASDITLSGNITLTSNTDNSQVKFAKPSSTVGYMANSADILNADWSILSGSAAIDAGADIAGITTDIAGRRRPKLTKADVGAYEYAASIDIAATGDSTTAYDATKMGDVVIRADSSGTGQWSAANTAVTDGVIKVVKVVEAGKVYAIGFPFKVSSVSRPFASLKSYNGATNELEDALAMEAGRGYLASFAAAGEVTFTSAPNPTLLTAYPEASATYKLAPALSLKNEASISGAAKYYSYSIATSTWGSAENAIAGGALKPFDAVIVSTDTGSYYATIGTGLPDAKLAAVAVAGEGHVTVTAPAKGFPTYKMGLPGGSFDLKFRVDEGYALDSVSIKTGTNPAELRYSPAAPVAGEYTVSINPVTDSVTITIATKKQELDVTVTAPTGVTITSPSAGASPYKVYYDSAFALSFTVDSSAKYLPQVTVGADTTAVVPPVENGEYVVRLPNVKANQAIAISLAAKKTVTLTAGAEITITKPSGGAGAYSAPAGSHFTYAFAVQYGYNVKVNGADAAAGEYTFALNNDTSIAVTATAKKWTVTLDTTGAMGSIALVNGAYPAGGYEVEHGQALAIRFSAANGKYPAVTPPKGVAYVLTKAQDVYTLALPYVANDMTLGLKVQQNVALPKGVVPVAEDVSGKGNGAATNSSPIFVINKGANNGNTYATHLKFDFSHLPLDTLARFVSMQLQLNTGWQANDAKGAQWMVTETADTWSETAPFTISNSPAPVDTIGTFTFGDIHPASPAADVNIYLDLTRYLKAWLAAPERSTDKTLSLRIYNMLQTNSGGEVDLKSKEATGDVGPKLIFGSVNTALSSLTVNGAEVLQANTYAYTSPLSHNMIGSKMPTITYALAEPSSYVVASPVAYTTADSTITAGQRNAGTFTVAPVAALEGEGAKISYSVAFPLPMEIGATETKYLADYASGGYNDIVFRATDASSGQLVLPAPLTVSGVVKVVRTVEANRFYAVGFPFGATVSPAPSELKRYDGKQLQNTTAIEKGKGYLIKFAAAGEVTFTSTSNPTLPSGGTIIPVANADTIFIANPYVNNVLYVGSMTGAYYRYNSVGHYFEKVISSNTKFNPVKTFEGIMVSTNKAPQYISLGSDSKMPHSVTYTMSSGITITSGQAASAEVLYDSAYVLTFTVDSCYENPAVTVSSSAYTLGSPDSNGVYTIRIDTVTTDTAINISATLKTFSVSVTNGANVTITKSLAATYGCGAQDTVKFTAASGMTPAVTVNNRPHPLNPPVGGEYVLPLTIAEVTVIDVRAAAPRRVTVNADSGVTIISTTGQATTPAGVYEAADSSAFMVTFKLNIGHNSPQVAKADLAGPDADGVYIATISAVTGDTAISITTLLNEYAVTVNVGSVAQVTAPAAPYKAKHGKIFTLEFTLNEGYENPKVIIGSTPANMLNSSSGSSRYTVSTGAITSDTAITITASLKRFKITITSDGHVTPSRAVGKHYTTYGSPFSFTFTLNEHYVNPQVTVGGAPYPLSSPEAGAYTVAIGAVTRDTAVSITASLETFAVSVAATNVTVISPTGADTIVTYSDTLALIFTVGENYENPQASANGLALTITQEGGAYIAKLPVTGATSVSLAAFPKSYDVTLTVGANVTLVQPTSAGTVKAAYGSAFVMSFRVAEGYTPVVKADGVEVAVGALDAQGVYVVTAVAQVSGEHYVALTAKKDDTPSAVYREDAADPVVRVQYYSLTGAEVRQPAVTGIYVVKRTLASKKVVVQKELVVVQ
jgi:hypothetical protein